MKFFPTWSKTINTKICVHCAHTWYILHEKGNSKTWWFNWIQLEASSRDAPAFTTVAAACFDHGTKEPEKNDKCGDQGGRDQAFQKKSVLVMWICKSPWWHLNLSPMAISEEVQHVVVMTLLKEVKLLPWMTSYISWTIHAIHAEYRVAGKQSRKAAGERAWFCYDVKVNLLICFAMKVATRKKNSSWSIQGSFFSSF